MANIRNSISLQDRMTPVFRSIIKSMDSTMKVMRQMDKQANNGAQSKAYRAAERDIKRANNELIRMENNLARCDKQADNLSKSTKGVSLSSANSSLSSFLTGLSSALYLAKNIASALSDAMEIPDAMSAIQYRLSTYDTTGATGSQLMDGVYRAAQASRSDIQSTADLASRLLISGATNGSGADAIGLAEILNKASFLGGSSSQESQRALLQLSQGLASGALQGDELRAIREQAPGLTDTLARGLSSLAEKGMLPEKFLNTTMGDLKQLGSEGELTAERIVAAFKEMEDYVDTTFEDSPKQFGQAAKGILNVWKRWLHLMNQGDNALAKITNKVWDLLEWFESPAGDQFFIGLANGVNMTVDVILQLIDWIGDLITWFGSLQNSSALLESAFITLGIVAAGAAAVAIAGFAATHWKLLLIIAVVYLIIYALTELGLTSGEIIGGIIGAIAFLGIAIYDIVVWILAIVAWVVMGIWDLVLMVVMFIVDLVVGIVTVIIWVVQGIVQIILWLITTIWSIIVTIYDVIYSIVMGIWGVIKYVIVGVYGLFVGLAQGVLGILWAIAEAIDWVFGSSLADSVEGWMKGLDNSVVELEAKLDPGGTFEDIGNQWSSSYSELGDMYAGRGEYDDWNITDNMVDTYNGAYNSIDTANNALYGATFYGEDGQAYKDVGSWAMDNGTYNPMDGWNSGMDLGQDISSSIGDISMKMEEYLNGDMTIGGGTLDSVGAIGSDVEISDEDIQLLKDVAARDFLLTLQTSTPQVNNTFGDIKETADVNKILDAIQDMVDEQLAVSLVVE